MRRWVARLVDFLGESIRVGLLGQTWVGTLTKIATVLLVTLGAPFGLQSTVKVAHAMLGQYELSLGTLLASAFLLIWISASCGYAWARSPWVSLHLGDELLIDPKYRYFGLEVRNDGFGAVEVAVYVTDICYADGSPVLPPAMGHQEIHWRGSHDCRQKLTHGRSHSVGLVQVYPYRDDHCYPPGEATWLVLGTMGNRHEPIDQQIPKPQRRKFWLRVIACDPDHVRAAKWFAIEPDATAPLGYRATTEEPPVLPCPWRP